MKKIYFLTIVLATCACTLFCYSLKNVNNMNDFFSSSSETMAQTETGAASCYCSADTNNGNKNCACNNHGAFCGSSEGTRLCSYFNSNCSGGGDENENEDNPDPDNPDSDNPDPDNPNPDNPGPDNPGPDNPGPIIIIII